MTPTGHSLLLPIHANDRTRQLKARAVACASLTFHLLAKSYLHTCYACEDNWPFYLSLALPSGALPRFESY